MSLTDKRATAGETVTFVFHAVDSSNANITGASDLEIRIWRASDQTLLDFSDSTFGGTVTDSTQTLTEADGTNMPGVYYWTKDLSTITNHTTSEDTWVIEARESAGSDLGFTPVGSLTVNPPDMIAALYQGKIHIDNANGTASSVLGVAGTPGNPTTTAALADTLSSSTGFKHWVIIDGPITLDATTYSNYTFEGRGWPAITLNSKNCVSCEFVGVGVAGTDGTSSTTNVFKDCLFVNNVALRNPIAAFRCMVTPGVGVTLTSGSSFLMQRCCDANDSTGTATIAVTDAANTTLTVADWNGDLTISGFDTASAKCNVMGASGKLTLDSSNTAGTIYVAGSLDLSDSSNGSTVERSRLVRPIELRMTHSLMYGNAYMDNTTYTNGHLDSARIRLFDSKANTDLATDGGSETGGLIATVTMTGTADSEYPTLPTVVKGTIVEA